MKLYTLNGDTEFRAYFCNVVEKTYICIMVRIEKGKMIVWNKTNRFWFLFVDDKPQGYFKTKKEAVNSSKELI